MRLLKATEKDANVNAVVILHSFGDGISYFIESGLVEIEPMFYTILKDTRVSGTVSDATSPSSHIRR